MSRYDSKSLTFFRSLDFDMDIFLWMHPLFNTLLRYSEGPENSDVQNVGSEHCNEHGGTDSWDCGVCINTDSWDCGV